MKWLIRFLLAPHQKLVRVKSYRPSIGEYGIEWPTMLVDEYGGAHRLTITPIWDKAMFRALWKGRRK